MDNEKNVMNTNTEQTVTKIVERIIDPKFDEQNRKTEELRADMRIAIGKSNADQLKRTIVVSALITGFGIAMAIGASFIVISLIK